MITVTKQENGVLFTFTNSDKYLYGSGTIEVPFNSLSIIQDESDNITLRKSASNDIFLSARYDTDFGYASKEEAVNALKEILYDEVGISEEEVQEMIDAATSGIPSSEVVEQLRRDVNAVSGEVDTLQDDVASKADASALTAVNDALTAHTANTNIHVTSADKSNWDAKQDALTAGEHITISGNVISAEAGNNIIELTQAEYDALVDKDPDALYIITDASEINMNDYATKTDLVAKADVSALTAVSDAVTGKADTSAVTAVQQSLSGKQDTLVLYTEETVEDYKTGSYNKTGKIKATSENGNYVADVYATLEYDGDIGDSIPFAAMDANTGDGLGDSTMTSVYVDGATATLYAQEDKDDGEGNTGFTSANISVNTMEIDMNVNDGTDEMQVRIDTTGVTINGDAIATEPYVDAALSGKADTSAVTTVSDALTAHTANTSVHVTSAEKTAWNAKADASALTSIESDITAVSNNVDALSGAVIDNEYTVSQAINSLNNRVAAVESGGSVTVDPTLDTGSTNPVANSAITNAINAKLQDVRLSSQSWVGPGVTGFETSTNGNSYTVKAFAGTINNKSILTGSNYANVNMFSLVETSAITTSLTSSSTDAQVPSAKTVYDQFGGLKLVKLTQAAYDALATKDDSVLYVIVD